MQQVEYYGYVKTDHDKVLAFAESASVIGKDFEADDESFDEFDLILSDEFRKCFPATRMNRALSGLWDVFDPNGVGVGAKEYHEPAARTLPTAFGAIFFSSRGVVEPVVRLIEHLRSPNDSATIFWSAVDCDPLTAPSGTIEIGPDGTRYWDTEQVRSEIDAADGDATTQLLGDRRLLLDMCSHLTSGRANPGRWIGSI